VVCDPFVGAGSTAFAAAGLGRRFVGCDIDADLVEQARRRVGG
jgi:DNA modification methylase